MPFRCFWTISKGRELAGANIESRIMQIDTKNSIRQLCMHTAQSLSRRGWAQLNIFLFTPRIKCLTFNRIAYLPQLTNRWKRQFQTFLCNKSLNARFTLRPYRRPQCKAIANFPVVHNIKMYTKCCWSQWETTATRISNSSSPSLLLH